MTETFRDKTAAEILIALIVRSQNDKRLMSRGLVTEAVELTDELIEKLAEKK